MTKPRVVFAYTEAGMGHIMPMKNIADAFEKKYGDKVECVNSSFFSETNKAKLIEYEKMLVNEVKKQNRHTSYGMFSTFAMEVFGPKLDTWYTMEVVVKGATPYGTEHIDELKADLVVSTHWATNYYAIKSKTKPLTVMYNPDSFITPLFSYDCDLVLCPSKLGYKRALKKKRFNEDNLKLVPFSIRKEAFEVSLDKKENRKKLGLIEDKFTILLAEGGYGIGKMEKICQLVVEKDLPVSLILLCGKNEELFHKISNLKVGKNTTLYPLSFTTNVFEYIASSDLFCGKSGASMMAEPCFFGVPQIITKHTTHIEKHNAEYYVDYVKSAKNIFNPKKVVKFIENCLKDDSELLKMRENALKIHDRFGSETTADYIFELLKTKFPNL